MGFALTICAAAAVHLERVLVAEDIDLDARPLARQGRNGAGRVPIVWSELRAVDKVAVVVANAVGTAVTVELWGGVVGANLLGR